MLFPWGKNHIIYTKIPPLKPATVFSRGVPYMILPVKLRIISTSPEVLQLLVDALVKQVVTRTPGEVLSQEVGEIWGKKRASIVVQSGDPNFGDGE